MSEIVRSWRARPHYRLCAPVCAHAYQGGWHLSGSRFASGGADIISLRRISCYASGQPRASSEDAQPQAAVPVPAGMDELVAGTFAADTDGNTSKPEDISDALEGSTIDGKKPAKPRGRPRKLSTALSTKSDPDDFDAAQVARQVAAGSAAKPRSRRKSRITETIPKDDKLLVSDINSYVSDGATRSAATAAADSAQIHPSPRVPPNFDLSAGVPKDPSPWEGVSSWVMFSDLHVSPKTVDVCVKVLQTVHRAACARNAGILFLGDFWHERGSLPVEPLNKVLAEVRTWRRPTLMLVGNHDQVSIGGLSHALTALEATSPLIHVIDTPTLFLGALWLPFRRDPGDLRVAMEHAGHVPTIFAHADVIGAFMNNAYQATHGIEADSFPVGTDVWLGHYHMPHVVPGRDGQPTRVRYVGSPYQVTRSEQGQTKALLVLDSKWKEVETARMPLDIGPRHLTASLARPVAPDEARAGDRVKFTVVEEELSDAEPSIIALRKAGVDVTVNVPPSAGAARIPNAETVAPMQLFDLYAEARGMKLQAAEEGREMLRSLQGGFLAVSDVATDVRMHSVTMEGYGSFRDRTTYDLTDRSLRVITGRNMDAAGADSNGSGKSKLVMAPLWALTGRSDARAEGGGGKGLTNAEVVHDDCKSAQVELTGTVNGVPFLIDRMVKRKGSGHLKLQLDGVDATGAEMALTKTRIEALFSTDLLTRAVFFAQTEVNALLEANDKELKNELAKLVGSAAWDAARSVAADRLKAAKGVLREAGGALSVRLQNVITLEQRLAVGKEEGRRWFEAQQGRVQQLRSQAASASKQQRDSFTTACQNAIALQHWRNASKAGQLVMCGSGGSCSRNGGGSWMKQVSQAEGLAAHTAAESMAQAAAGAASLEHHPLPPPTEQDELAARQLAEKRKDAAAALEAAEKLVEPCSVAVDVAREIMEGAREQWAVQRDRLRAAQQTLDEYLQIAEVPGGIAVTNGAAAAVGMGPKASWKEGAALSTTSQPHEGHVHSFSSNGEDSNDGNSGASPAAVCDRCLQPIDADLHAVNVERLEAQTAAAAAELSAIDGGEAVARASLQGVLKEQTRLEEAACQARTSLAAAQALEREGALDAQRRARDRLYSSQQEAAAAREAHHTILRLKEEMEVSFCQATAGVKAFEDALDLVHDTDVARSVVAQWQANGDRLPDVEDSVETSWLRLLESKTAFLDCVAAVQNRTRDAADSGRQAAMLRQQEKVVSAQPNAAQSQADVYAADLDTERAEVAALLESQATARAEEAQMAELVTAFGASGIKSFLLEDVLGALQDRTQQYLQHFAPEFSLQLSPVTAAAGGTEVDRISKVVLQRRPSTSGQADRVVERSAKSLSGGERRRVALALAFGFADLVKMRGNLHCNVMVLDEVMQHLDEQGCESTMEAIMQMDRSSIFVVGQIASFATKHLDLCDTVVKENGVSTIQIGA